MIEWAWFTPHWFHPIVACYRMVPDYYELSEHWHSYVVLPHD